MMAHRLRVVFCLLMGVVLGLAAATPAAAQAQSNAGDLVGTVTDPTGAVISEATVTVHNLDTGLVRTTTTDAEGNYRLLTLPPGRYEITVEKDGFQQARNPEIPIQIGQRAEWNVSLLVGSRATVVDVTTETQLVETTNTAITQTVTQVQKDNLPINERNYINFSQLDSAVRSDSAQQIGAAPSSGLNFGGQRGRSNQVSVDGADATDNSVNGVRSTVSQEAVQEFQIVTNSYMPEFGRAIGGVVNIVTRRGGNDLHGNLFGFIRNRHFEARNPFSTVSDPAFTRFEGGATLGGPLKKDRAFFFLAYETRQRHEEGFSSIGQGNFGLVSTPCPVGAPGLLTPDQAAFVANAAVPLALRAPYCGALREASSVALTGLTSTGFPVFPSTGAPLPASFVQLKDRKSTRLNSSHIQKSRMPSSA